MADAIRQRREEDPELRLIALGQTVFWDEPVKAGVAREAVRQGVPFVAGVHDTDYFAKLPGAKGRGYRAFPHNDHSTRGLWSAVGEFSCLFGSEAVVRRDLLQAAGVNLERLARVRPSIADEATEAWGWRGIVSMEESPPIAAELSLAEVYPVVRQTLDWALEASLASIAPDQREQARREADTLRDMADSCRTKLPASATLSDFYRALLPRVYDWVVGETLDLTPVRTSELLRFNRETAGLPRFDLLSVFLHPETREAAVRAYDEAVAGSEIYTLDRFGSCALPFDLVIPQAGRGTLRVGRYGLVVETPVPRFAAFEEPVRTVGQLADVIEARFGPNCLLVGKAVTLIGMLGREFSFVFHEGASSYVRRSRAFHDGLREMAPWLEFRPILRVRYRTWDALEKVGTWFTLPEPFRRPFGADDVCAPTFARRWQEVVQDQSRLLEQLAAFRRPIELIRFLATYSGGGWASLAEEYEQLHRGLEGLRAEIDAFRDRRRRIYDRLRALRRRRVEAEMAKGAHFRARIFEREATTDDWSERARLTAEVETVIAAVEATRRELEATFAEQRAWVSRPEVQAMHERRRNLEIEAEFKRLRLVRHAIIVRDGLTASDRRPAAWWLRLVSPDGTWFHRIVETAECYWEPLQR